MTKLNSIIKILKQSKYVNNYTKLLLLLNNLNYYGDYYIPNKKLQRMLNINKNRVIVLLHQAEAENIIRLIYRGKKRYFIFNNEKNEEDVTKKPDLFDYNWLEDSED